MWGATAAELVTACVAGAAAVSMDPHLVLEDDDGGAVTVHYLQTRKDGVVVVHADGGTPRFSAPPSWVVFQRVSCSKGIDYEGISLRRGDAPLLTISEGPDGDLEVARAGEVVESIPQKWMDAKPVPRDPEVTFRELAEKWLARVAPGLGDAAAVLVPDGELAVREARSAGWSVDAALLEGDEIPF